MMMAIPILYNSENIVDPNFIVQYKLIMRHCHFTISIVQQPGRDANLRIATDTV